MSDLHDPPEVDAYLNGLDADKRTTLQQLRDDLGAVLPDAEEGLSYGVPVFRLAGRPVAGFSAAKRHLSYLPHSGSVLASLPAGDLAGYTWSKGALKFAIGEPLPRALIEKLVAARRAELEG